MSLSALLVEDLEMEGKKTREMLALVPEAKFSWKPHEKSMTLGALASHLAETPSWTGALLEPEMDFAKMGEFKPYVAANRADLLATFDKNTTACIAALKGRDDASMNQHWTMRNGPTVIWATSRRDALRQMLVHHVVHHRGQLSVYLRMLGVPLPPIYGPTADHPQMG